MGYRVSRAGVVPGRKARKRARLRIQAAAARGDESLRRCLASYRGIYLF